MHVWQNPENNIGKRNKHQKIKSAPDWPIREVDQLNHLMQQQMKDRDLTAHWQPEQVQNCQLNECHTA